MIKTRERLLLAAAFCVCLALAVTTAFAGTPAELAAETEAYVKSTSTNKPIESGAIIAKVNEACKLLQAEGEAAFPKFQGKDSKFLFHGTYIWIHSLKDGKMLMHPIKYKLNGRQLLGIKDKKGKRFFVLMNKVASENGSGWVSYYWPKPGSKDVVQKYSYVKKCTMAGGKEVVIGCGIYAYMADKADIAKLKIH